MDDEATPRDHGRVAALLAALMVGWIGYAVAVQQPFFADGGHFFLKLLEVRWFIYGDDFARHHAHYLTQAPMVLLMQVFRVRDVGLLAWAFGLGLYLPHLVGLAASYLVVRETDVRLMVFPVFSLFGITANHSFMIVHESEAATGLLWPLLLYVLLVDEYGWRDAASVLVLSLLFIRTYETVAVFGALLVVLLALRLWKDRRRVPAATVRVWSMLSAVMLAGILIAIHSAIFPRLPGNRGDFLDAFPRVLRHGPFVLSMAYLAAMGLLFALPRLAGSRVAVGLGLLLLVPPTVFVALIPVVAPELTRPGQHHAARSLIVLSPFVLALVAIAVVRGLPAIPGATWRSVWTLMILLAVGQASWQVLASGQWAGFRRVFKEELAGHQGPVAFERTVLQRERRGIQLLRPMTWGWTQPTLSVLWSQGGRVEAIILNPVSEGGRWQPFDPAIPESLPRVEAYGFTFAPYLKRLEEAGARAPEDGASR